MRSIVWGVVVSFDAGTYRATIRLDSSLEAAHANVPVAAHLTAAQLPAGRRVAVAVFDSLAAEERLVIGSVGP